MSKKQKIFEILAKNYLFAVIRGKDEEEAYNISKATCEGGIKNIEVTFSTPGAENVIKRLSEEFVNTEIVVGAGTVLDEVTARIAILNGASFIVSPNFDEKIAIMCNLYMIPYLPGCGTVTEVVNALKCGVEAVKVFPGGVLTSSFIKDVHGPIPYVNMMPSGGVNIKNLADWVKKGSWAVGVGSALTKDVRENDYSSVTKTAKEFVVEYEKIRAN